MATIREQQLENLQNTNAENISFYVYDKDGVAKSQLVQSKDVLKTVPSVLQPINQNLSIEYLRPLKDVIKNSSFHKEWFRIGNEARKLKVLDISNIDSARLNNSKIISVFDRILTNIDNNDPLMSDEVYVYTQVLGGTFNTVFSKMQEFRELRKTIELAPNMSGDEKRKQINELYALENIMLKEYLDGVAEADIDFVLEKTIFGIFKVPTYQSSDDKKKSIFKRSDFEE